jgi:hypothetical protein
MTILRKIEPEIDGVVKDGQVIRVPMTMMDATQKSVAASMPVVDAAGYSLRSGILTDDQRDTAIERQKSYDSRISNSWKQPVATERDPSGMEGAAPQASYSRDELQSLRAVLQEKYDRRVSNAWKEGNDVQK